MVIIDLHLGFIAHIIAMNHSIVEEFAQSSLMNLLLLHTLHSLVVDRRFEVFALQELDDFVSHLENVALQLILKQEVGWSFPKST